MDLVQRLEHRGVGVRRSVADGRGDRAGADRCRRGAVVDEAERAGRELGAEPFVGVAQATVGVVELLDDRLVVLE